MDVPDPPRQTTTKAEKLSSPNGVPITTSYTPSVSAEGTANVTDVGETAEIGAGSAHPIPEAP